MAGAIYHIVDMMPDAVYNIVAMMLLYCSYDAWCHGAEVCFPRAPHGRPRWTGLVDDHHNGELPRLCHGQRSLQLLIFGNGGWKLLLNPLSPHAALKHHFTSLKKPLHFPRTRGIRMKISMKLVYDTWWISLIFHPHQVIFIHYKSRIAPAIRGL